jgi:drug/metabolite transporter (DMT)-like permease
MFGIFVALTGTLLLVLADTGKKHLSVQFTSVQVVWSTLVVGIAINVLYLGVAGLPEVNWQGTLTYLPLSVALLTAGELAFMYTLRSLEFSLVIPLRALSPLFAVPISFGLFGEYPSTQAAIGMLLIVGGVFFLFRPVQRTNLRALRSPAAVCVLFCAVNQPVLASVQRIGASESSPVLYFTLVLIGELVVFTGLARYLQISPLRAFAERPGFSLGTAILWGLGITFVFVAVQYTLVAYVIAILQLAALFSIAIGALVFHEPFARQRVMPSIAVVIGAACVVLQ